MQKALLALVLSLVLAVTAVGQGTRSFTALRLPASSHVAALGGENITLVDDSPWAGWANPALYSGVSDRSLGVSFMTWADGGHFAGAQFVKAFGQRHTAALTAQYLHYGSMTETDADGLELGEFSARDVVVGGAYSYLLSPRWAGGAALKLISSRYADYTSFALAVDLGLNYYDDERDLSASLALRSVGAPLKSFHDDRTERLPFDMQLGLTKGMAHAPVRFSVTLTDLTHWRRSDYQLDPDDDGDLSFARRVLSHVVVGVDVLPTEQISLSVGYNFRRGYELRAAGSSALAGLTLGAGLQLRRLRLQLAYARHHRSYSSLSASIGYVL